MQNRYCGDRGDSSKLGLLRALQSAGFTIGLNWYLALDETHNGDGRQVDLTQENYRACDGGLWLGLKAIVDGEDRQVRYMENDGTLQATFFSDCLDFSVGAGNPTSLRTERVSIPKGENRRCRLRTFRQ